MDLISVYPNPAGSLVKIDSLKEVKRISIFNAAGSLVWNEMISSLPAEINLSHLVSGIYCVWIYHSDEEAISRKTLIVQAEGA